MSTGRSFLESIAAGGSILLQRLLETLFGPGVQRHVLGDLTIAELAIFGVMALLALFLHSLTAGLLRRRISRLQASEAAPEWKPQLFQAVSKPFFLLIWLYAIYLAATPLLMKLPSGEPDAAHPIRALVERLFDLGVFIVLVWVFVRLTRVLEARLLGMTAKTTGKMDDILVSLLGRSLRVIVPVLGIIFALPVVGLSYEHSEVLARGSSVLLIATIAWVLFQFVNVGEKAVLAKYDLNAADNLQARKVYTQVHVLSKTLYVLIIIFGVASVLMLFEEVRRFGTSLLASAGVMGIIVGFAAQRTIANLFAGFQIAMTQPIRLDDVVIVEGEWGRIEEITLTYVVVKIWDERRLVLPISYFIEKPFQNWTRVSSEILGSIFLFVDYTFPVEKLRPVVKQIVESSPLWDKRFWNVQVTEATERTMQVRVLATSADASKAWDLRCDIREKLIEYLQRHHPGCLPRTRAELPVRLGENGEGAEPRGGRATITVSPL